MRLAQLEGEANLLRRKVAELQKGMDRLQQVRCAPPGWPPRGQKSVGPGSQAGQQASLAL